VTYQELTIDRLGAVRGADVFDRNGEKIGAVEEVFYGVDTNRPEWLGIGTGFFGTKRILVPLEGATVSDEGVTVGYSKDQVKDAPDIHGDELSAATESELYAHYGVAYGGDRAFPAGDRDYDRQVDLDRADVDASREGEMTRSEEELRVGKEEVATGRLRLHKWVETEQVDVPVELKKEKARVYREPANEVSPDAAIRDDALDVTLREERPVVEKHAVAKERIGIETDTDVETETVSGKVRKERVEIESDDEQLR